MKYRSVALAAFILLILLAVILPGQIAKARIYGNVTDENGEYLKGVTVTATNIGNNDVATTTTGKKKGVFRFLSLATGIYQVSADLEGYHSYVASGIQLSAEQSVTLHIKLKLKKEGEN